MGQNDTMMTETTIRHSGTSTLGLVRKSGVHHTQGEERDQLEKSRALLQRFVFRKTCTP